MSGLELFSNFFTTILDALWEHGDIPSEEVHEIEIDPWGPGSWWVVSSGWLLNITWETPQQKFGAAMAITEQDAYEWARNYHPDTMPAWGHLTASQQAAIVS